MLEQKKIKATTKASLDDNALKELVNGLFNGVSDALVMFESTPRVLLDSYKSLADFDLSNLIRLRIFNEKVYLDVQKDGDSFVANIIEETDDGQEVYTRDQDYVLRDAPDNLCKGSTLYYREYFKEADDGMLLKYAERFFKIG